jgi:DNA-binding NarL/FixJ family response regulator
MRNTRQTVLIVDDSPLIMDRLTEILEDMDCVGVISKASDYGQAIKILAEEKTDIALLDIHLPGKNGIELLQFIKAKYKHIKVIMLTNQSSIYYRDICAKEDASHFIDKSKEFENIPDIVSSFA